MPFCATCCYQISGTFLATDTFSSRKVPPCTSSSSYHGVPGKRNATVHFAATVPPNSPDLNPVDYSMWSILQDKVYKTCITDLNVLKHRIRTEWAKLDHAVIAAAVRQWRQCLSACVKAGGGHFEHCF